MRSVFNSSDWPLIVCVGLALVCSSSVVQAQSIYVPPSLFEGVLLLSTTGQLHEDQRAILTAEFRTAPATSQLLAVGEFGDLSSVKLPDSLQTLIQLKWSQPPQVLTASSEAAAILTTIGQLRKGDGIWVDADSVASWPADRACALTEALRGFLQRGGLVYVEVTSQLPYALQLLPEMVLMPDRPSGEDEAENSPWPITAVAACIPRNGWLRIDDRQLVNLSLAPDANCEFRFPPTIHYPAPLVQTVPRGRVADLIALRRAWYERQLPEFPAPVAYEPQLSAGSLVIVGGGRTSAEIWKKFVELAGGHAAKIVVLPTAIDNPTEDDGPEAQIFKRFGASEVRVLPQIDRPEVSSPEFLQAIKQATGVWFGGGRQWRFVDAYWGTPAWHELQQVVARGGVIGGSSAGATIQGDLLVRGHPLGNQIMIADGYRRGLGLLAGVAIDQHFRQRNRFDDLAQVVERFPSIIGIGIDEATALVVEAPNRCQVIGEGSVWLSRPSHAPRNFQEFPTGQEFTLSR